LQHTFSFFVTDSYSPDTPTHLFCVALPWADSIAWPFRTPSPQELEAELQREKENPEMETKLMLLDWLL
jgi:hypothetical protein